MRVSGKPDVDVDAFLSTLEHPFRKEILALRKIILGAGPGIREGIKWNAPSFRTSEDFATFQLRAKDGVQVILHRGAKKRSDALEKYFVADPDSLLEWAGSRPGVGEVPLARGRGGEAFRLRTYHPGVDCARVIGAGTGHAFR